MGGGPAWAAASLSRALRLWNEADSTGRDNRSNMAFEAMKRSTDRILSTHVGSLIRPPKLLEYIRARQSGQAYDEAGYDRCLTESVAEVVQQQADAGISVVSDGEFGKSISWSQYLL